MVVAPKRRVLPVLAWVVLLFLLLPCILVVPVSLTDTDYLAMPEQGLSLRWWHTLFASPEWMVALGQSLGIGLAATAIAVSAGTLCAIGCWRARNRWSALVRALILVPMIVPTVVYALGLFRVYAKVGLLDSFTGVILAHAALALPYPVLTVGAALTNFDPRLEQAARNLGASGWQVLRLVTLPNLKAGILSGAIFAFVVSWDELVVVLFIAGRRVHTLPRQIWSGIRENLDPTIAAVATLLIAVTLLALIPVLRGSRTAPKEA
ncbi:ABC transporter permease [Lichenihabitans sp. Uapishka_5]|uniref:ABC transporter permease n=1 Tax=Lichenihabitans sp. Uapishka_5 TaxID=3037302 RepID=UPI0029E81D71|nr:ABC transporter permease [Lichenihabitans sp. Uapishka_5]MDX7951754.1 ABC transporter permease [Lichenihabitans sp. Uapishka_5]